MTQRRQIAPGAYVSVLETEKFCRQRVSINFIWPAEKEWATAEALLALTLERGYAGCPDMTELSKRLARLYGAGLSVDTAVNGGNRVLTVSVSGIKDRFALSGEALSEEYCAIAFGTAFAPVMKDGVIDPGFVEIEREQLREQLEGEINEKRTYCIRQARRKFFGSAPAGVERWGYLEELDGVTPQQVTRAFARMVETAQIEVLCLGLSEKSVVAALQQALAGLEGRRRPGALRPMEAMPRQKEACFDEPMDTVQGKLCMLFTGGGIVGEPELSAMRVAVALLGGTATSRLFQNVREKLSLCYYCSAGYTASTGMLCIDSGVEHANADAAKEAILREFAALKEGPVTEQELQETKRALKNALCCVNDNLGSMENWWFGERMRGSEAPPEQVIREIEAVTEQDVKDALGRFTLSVTYRITKGGEAV